MKKDADDLPIIGPTSLGVRPGVDIDVDASGDVLVNGKGMSVNSAWRTINVNRIPKRLRHLVLGAGGSNNSFCFRFGEGDFVQSTFADGLTLEPDSATHANVAPESVVPLATYEDNIAATRSQWVIDES